MKSISKVLSKLIKPELTPVLKSKGFTLEGNVLVAPKGDRFIRTIINGKPVLQKEENYLAELAKTKAKKQEDNKIKNAHGYVEHNGNLFQAVPIKTNETKILPIITLKTHPSSNAWKKLGVKDDPIRNYIQDGSNGINISEVPLKDSLTKKDNIFYTILGTNVGVKALKGGTGLFDLAQKNPFLSLILPSALTGTTILATSDND